MFRQEIIIQSERLWRKAMISIADAIQEQKGLQVTFKSTIGPKDDEVVVETEIKFKRLQDYKDFES